jgi:hypothetical protein
MDPLIYGKSNVFSWSVPNSKQTPFYLEHIHKLLICPLFHVSCSTAEIMYIRLATRWIELHGQKIRTLVTPERDLNEQCYWWEISGEADALIIHSYTPISNLMFIRKKAIFGTCMQYYILVMFYVWYGALKIEVRVTWTGEWPKYQLICSGNLFYLLT